MPKGINQHPNNGKQVFGECIFCERKPNPGEKYGIGPKDWDFTNICPECWDKVTGEPEDDDTDLDPGDLAVG